MNLFSGLLFLHGHIADADLARRLAEPVKDAPRADVLTDAEAAPQPQHAPCLSGAPRA